MSTCLLELVLQVGEEFFRTKKKLRLWIMKPYTVGIDLYLKVMGNSKGVPRRAIVQMISLNIITACQADNHSASIQPMKRLAGQPERLIIKCEAVSGKRKKMQATIYTRDGQFWFERAGVWRFSFPITLTKSANWLCTQKRGFSHQLDHSNINSLWWSFMSISKKCNGNLTN